ncbi:MAG: response regulator [Clostridioides sp.]|jgi:DNA-binding LytR/AlgR family response regulator|nr:response regulator [Clostridioides sp.]
MITISINIAICEYDLEQQNILRKSIDDVFTNSKYNPEVNVYSTGENLINNYSDDTDIYILDMELYNEDGLEIAKKIREVNQDCEIVFVAFLQDRVQEGYEVGAFDYLFLPVSMDELRHTMYRCAEKIEKCRKNHKVLIEDENKNLYVIKINSILCIDKIDTTRIRIYTNDREITIKKNVSLIGEILNEYSIHMAKQSKDE